VDGDRVVTLEGDKGGRFGELPTQSRFDPCAEWAEMK
jgi:hypothetical protein